MYSLLHQYIFRIVIWKIQKKSEIGNYASGFVQSLKWMIHPPYLFYIYDTYLFVCLCVCVWNLFSCHVIDPRNFYFRNASIFVFLLYTLILYKLPYKYKYSFCSLSLYLSPSHLLYVSLTTSQSSAPYFLWPRIKWQKIREKNYRTEFLTLNQDGKKIREKRSKALNYEYQKENQSNQIRQFFSPFYSLIWYKFMLLFPLVYLAGFVWRVIFFFCVW